MKPPQNGFAPEQLISFTDLPPLTRNVSFFFSFFFKQEHQQTAVSRQRTGTIESPIAATL